MLTASTDLALSALVPITHSFTRSAALTGAILLATSAHAQLTADSIKTDSIETAAINAAEKAVRHAPEVLDLGEMIVGQPKTAPYTVRNAGTEPLVVESIKGGCGCTTVSAAPKEPLAPGASFTVQVTVDPGKRGGIDLAKPLYVTYAGGVVESAQIKGRIRAVAAVVPSTIDAIDVSKTTARVSIDSIDGRPFRVIGVAPEGILALPAQLAPERVPRSGLELAFSYDAWDRAGRPGTLVVSTDLPGAAEIVVPVRSSDAVSMFRLPSLQGEGASRAETEAAQTAIVDRIDAGITDMARSVQFRMKLHRESGMLFVHGTEAEVEEVRRVVRALPPSMGVRESHPEGGN